MVSVSGSDASCNRSYGQDDIIYTCHEGLESPAVSVMKILSVNVGLPRQIISDSKPVTTGIFKTPVQGRLKVGNLNLEGDGQADLSAHGGRNKAVYAYPSEHYAWWRSELPGMDLPWGMFGENLTLEGMQEEQVHVGDRFRMGTAVLMVTQPRLPCYKLGIRLERNDMPERFLESGRTGFYFAVVEEGELGADDVIEFIEQGANQISIATILRLYRSHGQRDSRQIERILQVEVLPEGWRKRFIRMLQELKI